MADLAQVSLVVMLVASIGIGMLSHVFKLSYWQCGYLTFLFMVGIVFARMVAVLVEGH